MISSKGSVVKGNESVSHRKRGLGFGLLIAWTLLVWVGRVRNILGDEDLAGWPKSWRLGVAIGFVAAGAALAVMILRKRAGGSIHDAGVLSRPSAIGNVASLLAGVGVGWWIVRGGGILLADHDSAFKAVHTVLGAVTIGLSGWVLLLASPPEHAPGR